MKVTKPVMLVCVILAAWLAVVIFAGSGFTQQQRTIPTYAITKSRATAANARILGESLGIKPEIARGAGFVDKNGLVAFADQELYQFVPTKQIGKGKAEEDKEETVLEAFDLNAIKAMKAPDEQALRGRFEAALKRAELFPDGAQMHVSHNTLQLFDKEGKTVAEANLDTSISYSLSIDNVPLIGPGSKVSATFNGEGKVTRLRYAGRVLRKGESAAVMAKEKAHGRFLESLQMSKIGEQMKNVKLDSRLVYYAPSLKHTTATTILPYYDVGGTATVGDQEVSLLRQLIPAVESPKFVPSVRLDASARGAMVNARVGIQGGKPPYKVAWSSNNVNLNKNTNSVSYEVTSRSGGDTETVMVTVTDANGVTVAARKALKVTPKGTPRRPPGASFGANLGGGSGEFGAGSGETPGMASGRDFGTENAVTNQFGNLEQGFINEMLSDGVTKRFSWTGTNAWEQDFKATGDSSYIDNTDITFYVGHGYPGGFTFEDTTHTDSALDYDDATGDWGDSDLEWLALLSCTVLSRDSWGGMTLNQRWSQEFDGLHLLLGFHTNAYAWSSFSGEFAHNMVRTPFLWWNKPMKVRVAWFDAVDSDQPDGVVAVVMGVWRVGDFVTNYNDYFWGKGTVGPDIRGSNILGFWSVTHTGN